MPHITDIADFQIRQELYRFTAESLSWDMGGGGTIKTLPSNGLDLDQKVHYFQRMGGEGRHWWVLVREEGHVCMCVGGVLPPLYIYNMYNIDNIYMHISYREITGIHLTLCPVLEILCRILWPLSDKGSN